VTEIYKSITKAVETKLALMVADSEMARKAVDINILEQSAKQAIEKLRNAEKRLDEKQKSDLLQVVYNNYLEAYKKELSIAEELLKSPGMRSCELRTTPPKIDPRTGTVTPGEVNCIARS
jgi:hypothetical protein